MIPISSFYLNCSIYVYKTKEDADSGACSGGSGFFVGVPLEVNKDTPQVYAVTAKHVLDGINNPVLRVNLTEGGCEGIETNRARWYDHPNDDFTVFPIDIDAEVYKARCTFISDFVNLQRNSFLYPGDEVFMIGRFISHEGKQQNSPSVRFGNISMLATETMKNKYDCDQETFLIEQRSLPGYSGSPVFVFLDPSQPRPPFWMVAGNRAGKVDLERTGPWLLGIDWVHIHNYEKVLVDGKEIGGNERRLSVKSHTGMAGVIPAWRLADFLTNNEELLMHRKKEDERITEEKKKSYLSYDSASEEKTGPQTTSTGYEMPVPTRDQFARDLTDSTLRPGILIPRL